MSGSELQKLALATVNPVLAHQWTLVLEGRPSLSDACSQLRSLASKASPVVQGVPVLVSVSYALSGGLAAIPKAGLHSAETPAWHVQAPSAPATLADITEALTSSGLVAAGQIVGATAEKQRKRHPPSTLTVEVYQLTAPLTNDEPTRIQRLLEWYVARCQEARVESNYAHFRKLIRDFNRAANAKKLPPIAPEVEAALAAALKPPSSGG